MPEYSTLPTTDIPVLSVSCRLRMVCFLSMLVGTIGAHATRAREIDPLVRAGKVGSVLDAHTIAKSNLFQTGASATRLKIPLLLGIDAIHGNALVRGTTIFPTPINLAATDADLVVVAVGDKTPRTDPSDRTAAENIDRSELDLPGRQLELVQKLAAMGKPVAVVLCTGRPLSTP